MTDYTSAIMFMGPPRAVVYGPSTDSSVRAKAHQISKVFVFDIE